MDLKMRVPEGDEEQGCCGCWGRPAVAGIVDCLLRGSITWKPRLGCLGSNSTSPLISCVISGKWLSSAKVPYL